MIPMARAVWSLRLISTLLSSHAFFLDQMKNQFLNQKNIGDTVVSTSKCQIYSSTAYNALGDRRGAVVVLEPSTGKILAEVSRPDFDPNTLSQNWDILVNDENDSSLLNRATNGAVSSRDQPSRL